MKIWGRNKLWVTGERGQRCVSITSKCNRFAFLPKSQISSTGSKDRTPPPRRSLVFYVNQDGRCLSFSDLSKHSRFERHSLDCGIKNKTRRPPNPRTGSSGVSIWMGLPAEVIDQLDYLLEVPIVLICDRGQNKQNVDWSNEPLRRVFMIPCSLPTRDGALRKL